MINVIVTGGRNYANREHVYRELDGLHEAHHVSLILHGAADGADTLAHEWAVERKVRVFPIPAWWKYYPNYSAGPIRNGLMLDLADVIGGEWVVVAFPGKNGTADMKARALARGRPVRSMDLAPVTLFGEDQL